MTTISAYILGALAMLAAEGAIFFLTLVTAMVLAAVSSTKAKKHGSSNAEE